MRVAEFYLIEGIKQVVPPFDGGLSFNCEVPTGFFFDPELLVCRPPSCPSLLCNVM